MPLITCPDCSKEVSDKAAACIHCGYPIKEDLNLGSVGNDVINESGRKCTLIICHALTGGGRIKDEETEELISFSPNEVSDGKLLTGYINKTLTYEKVDGRLKIYAPSDAPDNPVVTQNSRNSPQYSTTTQTSAPSNSDGEKITKNYLWYIIVLVVAAGYWIAKGTPNPILFFAGSSAKEECLNLANENKASLMLNTNEVTANDTWLKDGKRVVQLLQKDEDNGVNQIMCIYGNGMVQIPSFFEQGRWR